MPLPSWRSLYLITMDFITGILAQLFDKFKLRNPVIAAAVLVTLFGLVQSLHQAVSAGLLGQYAWLTDVLRWLTAFLMAVTGAKTTLFLDSSLRADREATYAARQGINFYAQDNREDGDILTRWLAWLFDKFKQASPKAAAWVLVLLVFVNEVAHRGVAVELFHFPAWADEALFVLSSFLIAVTGARTVSFLPSMLRKDREKEYASARRLEGGELKTSA